MLRRACLILCLLVFAGSAGLWVRTYFARDFLSWDGGGADTLSGGIIDVRTDRGRAQLGVYVPKGHWGSGIWVHHATHAGNGRLADTRPFGSQPFVPWEIEAGCWYWARVQLCPLTFLCALFSLGLWRPFRRRGGRGFPVEKPAQVQSPPP